MNDIKVEFSAIDARELKKKICDYCSVNNWQISSSAVEYSDNNTISKEELKEKNDTIKALKHERESLNKQKDKLEKEKEQLQLELNEKTDTLLKKENELKEANELLISADSDRKQEIEKLKKDFEKEINELKSAHENECDKLRAEKDKLQSRISSLTTKLSNVAPSQVSDGSVFNLKIETENRQLKRTGARISPFIAQEVEDGNNNTYKFWWNDETTYEITDREKLEQYCEILSAVDDADAAASDSYGLLTSLPQQGFIVKEPAKIHLIKRQS